jgi:type VI secretion system protein ImpL
MNLAWALFVGFLGLLGLGSLLAVLSASRIGVASHYLEKIAALLGLKRRRATPDEISARARRKERFDAALERIDASAEGKKRRYTIPWSMVLGEKGSGRTAALSAVKLHCPFGKPTAADTADTDVAFWLFDKGLAIEAPGLDLSGERVWASESYGFAHFLDEIRAARRLRPIDGIVLVLPATDFIGPKRLSQEELQRKAEGLFKNVWHIKTRLAVRCPIYVLITKADRIPGFAAFARVMPTIAQDAILGWSSPYASESPYSSKWLDAAFEQIGATVCAAELEMLAGRTTGAVDHEKLFALPVSLATLLDPLRVVLDNLLKSNIYGEPLPFRGLYLAGDASTVAAAAAEPKRAPVFVTDLFGQKVFSECGLSRPDLNSQSWSRRVVTAMKWGLIACLVLAPVGLWSGARSVRRAAPPVTSLVDEIAQHVTKTGEAQGELTKKELNDNTISALRKMSEIQTNGLWRPEFPTTWFTSIDGNIEAAMRLVFELVVFPTFRWNMDRQRDEIFGAGEERTATDRIVRPENMPEFVALRFLDENIAKLAVDANKFNSISAVDRQQKLVNVQELTLSLLAVDLSPKFLKRSELYDEALAEASYTPFMMPSDSEIRERADVLATALEREAFLHNPIDQDLTEIVERIGHLRTSDDYGDAGVSNLRGLSEAIARAEADLAMPEVAWMTRAELGEPFLDLLASIRRSQVMGEAAAVALEARWRAEYLSLRERLYASATPSTGPLLLRDRKKLTLDPKVIELKALVDAFLAQSYVRLERKGEIGLPTVRATRTLWDDEELVQADRLAEPYRAYVGSNLALFPADLRDHMRGMAHEQLELSMRYLVAHARRVETSPRTAATSIQIQADLSSEIANLKRAIDPLRGVLSTYASLGLSRGDIELRSALAAQGDDLLERADLLLDADRLYAADEKLSRWRGPEPPAFAAFSVDSEEMLAAYLKAQRARVEELAQQYAALPVALLEAVAAGPTQASSARLNRWQRILAELRKYEIMSPGNSVKLLESFIQNDMMTEAAASCQDALSRATGGGGDYFLFKRALLREALRRRCAWLSVEKLLDAYDRLAKHFNRSLAGRYPFSREDSALSERDAEPKEIRAFLEEFDAFVPSFDAYVTRRGPGGATMMADVFGEPAIAFLGQMRAVRRFFSPLVTDGSPDAQPRYELAVQFRVNRHKERLANQIIDWRFEVADRLVLATDPEAKPSSARRPGEDDGAGVWQIGDPLQVSLRWAKDGPFLPDSSVHTKGVRVDENGTVLFEYRGAWALIRLLRNQRSWPADLEGGVDVQPHTLKFTILLDRREIPYGAPAIPLDAMTRKAEAFLRVVVAGPGGRVRIAAPSEWPTYAPPPAYFQREKSAPQEAN